MLPLDHQPSTVCILRLSALGDATHVLPVVRSIRQHWPGTRITWIIGTLERRLMSGLENVEFIEFDKKGGLQSIRRLRREMKGRRFDVLLQMQVAARANLLSRLIRAPVRLGWDVARSRDMHQLFVNCRIAAVPFQHQVQGFLEFSRALGIPARQPNWNLPVSSEARNWAERQLGGQGNTLLISPCSSHPRRNWNAAGYAAVADHAQQNLGLQVVLSGGRSQLEQNTARAIEKKMSGPCLNLVGRDTLEQSKALLRLASVVIAPDSGPVHIASALDTPVIGLYAATWSRRSGPYNSLDLCVDRFEQAAEKFRKRPPEALRWGTRIEEPGVMDLIRIDDVIGNLDAWHRARGGIG